MLTCNHVYTKKILIHKDNISNIPNLLNIFQLDSEGNSYVYCCEKCQSSIIDYIAEVLTENHKDTHAIKKTNNIFLSRPFPRHIEIEVI